MKCSTPGCDREVSEAILKYKPTATLCKRCFDIKEQQRRDMIVRRREGVQQHKE